MRQARSQAEASLLDVLIDGFEKNEVYGGFHWRDLPMPAEAAAIAKFGAFVDEATRWHGPPERQHAEGVRRMAAWPGLEIRQAGRGIRVRVAATTFSSWWHASETWSGDPMGPIWEWIDEERERD